MGFNKRAGDAAAATILVGTRINRLSQKLGRAPVEPKRVEGGEYPPVKLDFERVINAHEDDKPFYVPRGPDLRKTDAG